MNRLVLIGNGFDLAHGLKTRYEDFINWYWEQWGTQLLQCDSKEVSDGLCSFKMNDNIQLNTIAYLWSGWHYKRDNPLIPWDPRKVINIATQDKETFEFKYQWHLLEKINQSVSTKKWVDIENDYYSLLEKRVAPINSFTDKDVEALNLQLDILRFKLIDYLKQEQQKEISIIDGIKDKIYRPIDKREISVGYKGLINSWLFRKKSPFATMLLNFNYTSTPEQYISDHPNIVINYIHGKLDNPQSVIFGYGDELDSSFKKLQENNENEALRHIKSIRYLESDNYRKMLEFVESAPFQICIMGHSCGNSDRTLLNTLFEHRNCVSIKPYYYVYDGGDNYMDLVMNISRNFTDMKLMRDRVVNKDYCEPLT